MAKKADICYIPKELRLAILQMVDDASEALESQDYDLDKVKAMIEACDKKPKAKGGKKKRKPSAYNVWIGHCMASPEKNGLGLPMSDCSEQWKGMEPEEKCQYEQQAKELAED